MSHRLGGDFLIACPLGEPFHNVLIFSVPPDYSKPREKRVGKSGRRS